MFCCCAEAGTADTVEPVGVPVLDDEHEKVYPELVQSEPALPPKEEKKKEEPPKPAVPPAPVKYTEEPKHYYYDVSLSKDGAHLGVELDIKQGGLNVESISKGSAVDKYNTYAEPAQKIQVLDFIVDVNGQTDPDAMLQSLKSDSTLKLRMFHSPPVNIKVNKSETTLGLSLNFADDSMNIDVADVKDGAAKAHNAKAPPESQIKAADVIISVNGIAGEASKMVEELKTATELNLVIIRAPA